MKLYGYPSMGKFIATIVLATAVIFPHAAALNAQSLNGSVSCAGGFFSCPDGRAKVAISDSSQRI